MYFKIKILPFIINHTKPFVMDKSKKRALVLKDFALFNWSSVDIFDRNKDYQY